MRRRSLLSASLGLGTLAGLGYVGVNRATPSGLALHAGSAQAFGTTVTIQVLHPDPASAQAAITAALQQVSLVDALMSVHQPRSQVYQLNAQGQLNHPDPHLLAVLTYARQLSNQTGGAFDITVQPLWQAFSQAQANGQLPEPLALARVRALVNWQGVTTQPDQIELAAPGMAITLNGLAQGYAVDLALAALRAKGVAHALLDTGEFGVIGTKGSDQPWVLGIKNPRQTDALTARVPMDGRALCTSGDYETFFSADFSHHHIFDPATGDSPTPLASVSVLAPTGMMADGLSTAFMVLGADKALALAARLPRVDALLIHKNGSQQRTADFPELSA
ncbi:FAD:protein FMN transferase [Rhodoferax antarcticus]|uniref:FAD:protein FMN transferase n=1 Tax=Rhodoferax antarcticus TaxID=81479 RepID=UPI0022245E8F|nr:FAD:protein FMN transferase [Rhodoferax antarcticus]MCW2313460.1 thiamine biosynthesis lipoprotein [Rhodoferax antarcticus]